MTNFFRLTRYVILIGGTAHWLHHVSYLNDSGSSTRPFRKIAQFNDSSLNFLRKSCKSLNTYITLKFVNEISSKSKRQTVVVW